MTRHPLPHYGVDKDALLAVADDGDPADFDAMLRLQEGGFLNDDLELTAEGRQAAKMIRMHRARRERERAAVTTGDLDRF